MFDSPLCKRPFTQFPLLFDNWGEFEWLKVPIAILTVFVLGLGLRSVFQFFRWQQWSRRPGKTIALMGLVVVVPLLLIADKGLTLFLPADPGTPVEAIVVLGRGTEFIDSRITTVTELWKAKRAPLIFVSGTGDTLRMLPILNAKGIPDTAIDGENCSLTTPENAIFSAAILHAQGIRQILLVTDPLHLWRSFLNFQDEGFTVIPYASPMPTNLGRWNTAFLTVREYLFLIAAGIERQVRGQRSHRLDSPELVNLVERAKQYGVEQRG